MRVLVEYAALALAPLACAPIQYLYMKSGDRYDLGAPFGIATGFLISGSLLGTRGSVPWPQLATTLLVALAGLFAVRVIVLAYGGAVHFTVISLAQMWAIVPVLQYLLGREGLYGGAYLGTPSMIPLSILLALAANLLCAIVLQLWRLDTRLRALTENAEVYSILMGSRLGAAFKIEVVSVACYLACGVLLGFSRNNLSAADFGREGLWIVLGAALIPQFRAGVTGATRKYLWFILAPLGCVVFRGMIRATLHAGAAEGAAYVLLAAALGFTAWRDQSVVRTRRT